MRSSLLIGIVSIVLVAVLPAAALGSPAAQSKKAACKGSALAVKIGKRRTCQPFARLFPKPRTGDIRLAYLKQALVSSSKAIQKKLTRVLPKALAFIDRRGGARPSALASGGCQAGPAGAVGHTGGASIGALGDNGGYIDAPAGGGRRVRITFVSCGGVNNFHLPECPGADGSVDGTGSGEFRATIEVRDGDQLVSRNSTVFEEKAKVHGEVGADAKLKSIDVEHTQEVFIVATGGIVIRGGVTRKVRIDMPGGSYDPGRASARFFGDPISTDSGADSFARTAGAAISRFRAAEPGWSTFNGGPYCAKAVFSPDSNTVNLKKGQAGQLSAYAQAHDGGRAAGVQWTLTGPVNAQFSPSASSDAAPTISYTVSGNPSGDSVRVTAKFTSTAGVGEGTWTQPIDKSQPLPASFAATFSGTAVYNGTIIPGFNGSIDAEWTGSAELKQMPSPYPPGTFPYEFATYELVSGSVDYSFNGSLEECAAEGGGQVDLGAQVDLKGTAVVTIFDKEPREYQFVLPMPTLARVPGSLSSCKDPEDEKAIEWPLATGIPALVNDPLPGGPVGADWSISGSRSGNTGFGSPNQTWQWSLSPSG